MNLILLIILIVVFLFLLFLFLYKKNWPFHFTIKNVNPNQTIYATIYINDFPIQNISIAPNQTIPIITDNVINPLTNKPMQKQNVSQIIIQTSVEKNNENSVGLVLDFGNMPSNKKIGLYQDPSLFKPMNANQSYLDKGIIDGIGFYAIKFPKGIPFL